MSNVVNRMIAIDSESPFAKIPTARIVNEDAKNIQNVANIILHWYLVSSTPIIILVQYLAAAVLIYFCL